jgi:hypothetical protein
MNRQQFSVRLNKDKYKKLKIIAKNNNRTINEQIGHFVDNAIKEHEKINGAIEIN